MFWNLLVKALLAKFIKEGKNTVVRYKYYCRLACMVLFVKL
jgi:hypothetical protein